MTNIQRSSGAQRVVVSSRHEASIEYIEDYCKRLGLDVVAKLSHIESFESLPDCEIVIGNLPLAKVAKLNKHGIRYGAFSITVPAELRGIELSRDLLDELSPRVIEFEAIEKGDIA